MLHGCIPVVIMDEVGAGPLQAGKGGAGGDVGVCIIMHQALTDRSPSIDPARVFCYRPITSSLSLLPFTLMMADRSILLPRPCRVQSVFASIFNWNVFGVLLFSLVTPFPSPSLLSGPVSVRVHPELVFDGRSLHCPSPSLLAGPVRVRVHPELDGLWRAGQGE